MGISTKKTTYNTTNDYVTIDYTADEKLTNVELTKDDVNYIKASSFNQTSATFHIPDWTNGTYSNCCIRGTFQPPQPPQPPQSSLLDSNGAYLFWMKHRTAPLNR